MKLLINKLGERLSGIIGEVKYNVLFTEELYTALKAQEDAFEAAETMEDAKAILAATLPLVQTTVSEIVTTACKELVFNSKTNRYYLKSRGVVSSIPVPKILVDWIIESIEKKIDYIPVVYAWTRFLRNPYFTNEKAERFAKFLTSTVVDSKERDRLITEDGLSLEVATERATFRDVSLTKTGLISTYKYGRVIFTKFDKETGERVDRYTKVYDEESGKVSITLPEWAEDYALEPPIMGQGGDPVTINGTEVVHRIKVGGIHTLNWNQVNTSNDQMSAGLWIGGLSYIKAYDAPDRLLMNCFVDPANIASFYHGANFDALKVREYFVHSAVFAPNKNLYRESSYDAHTTKEWEKLRSEAIALSEAKIKKHQDKQAELLAL